MLFIIIFIIGWIIPLSISFYLKGKVKRFFIIIAGVWFVFDATCIGINFYNKYTITEKNNIKNFNIRKYNGKLGDIVFQSSLNAEFVLKNEQNDYLRFVARNGTARVPVGKYRLYSYDLTVKDKYGVNWNLWYHYRYNRKNGITINVNNPQQNKVLLGPPMVMLTQVKQTKNGNVRVVCPIKDQYNNFYKLIKKKNKKINFFRVNISGIDNSIKINEIFDCSCGGILTKTLEEKALTEGLYKVSPILPKNLPFAIDFKSTEFRYKKRKLRS